MSMIRLWRTALVVLFAATVVWLPLKAYALPVGFDTSNLILHLDAQDASSINGGGASDNDAVTGWNDLSGNNNNAASGGGEDNPHYAATGINGNPAVRFDHTQGDALAIADDASFNLEAGQSFTAVYVGTYENSSVGAPSPNKVIFDKRTGAPGFKGLYVGYERRGTNRFDPPAEAAGDTISLQTNGDETAGVNTRPNELAEYASTEARISIWESRRDGGEDDGFYFGVGGPSNTRGVNDKGEEFVSTGPVSSTGSIATLGRSEEIGASSGVTASMGELILFGRELTASEQATLGQFLSSKWGTNFVPEPSTLALTLFASLGLLGLGRRRR